MNNKKGDIVYESSALDCHVVSFTNNKVKVTGNRIRALKFEERFKGHKNIPVNYLSELSNLWEFRPFSYPNGRTKYTIYSFSKKRFNRLQPRTQKTINDLIHRSRKVGLTLAYKEFNSTSRNLSKKLKVFELSNQSVLDDLWNRSYVNFIGI